MKSRRVSGSQTLGTSVPLLCCRVAFGQLCRRSPCHHNFILVMFFQLHYEFLKLIKLFEVSMISLVVFEEITCLTLVMHQDFFIQGRESGSH